MILDAISVFATHTQNFQMFQLFLGILLIFSWRAGGKMKHSQYQFSTPISREWKLVGELVCCVPLYFKRMEVGW